MAEALPETVLQQLFTEARSHKAWRVDALPADTFVRLYDLIRWGPTSNNSAPARFVFASTEKGKAEVLSAVHAGNLPKVAGAPAIVVICADEHHWQHWQRLSPHKDLAAIFADDPLGNRREAERNALLQAGYFILGVRALGLDVFPLTGFDRERLKHGTLLPTSWHPLMLCCLGKGDPDKLRPRAARLDFNEACRQV